VQCRAADPAERAKLLTAVHDRVLEAVGIACEVVPVPPRSLPKTSSGKLARTRTKVMFERGELSAVSA
jgi:fatty-acyl-CoA synthase